MNKLKKGLFIAAGSLCVILAFIGIFVPLMPTTAFLLLAAYFFTRSSKTALHWLEYNRLFGSYIRNYRAGLGIPLREKIFTLSILWVTIGATVIFAVDNLWVRLLLIAIATGVTVHVVSIKTYHPGASPVQLAKELE